MSRIVDTADGPSPTALLAKAASATTGSTVNLPTETPAAPLARIASVAASAGPPRAAAFQPTSTCRALAGALIVENPGTFSDLAKAAGVSRSSLYETIENPDACSWILGHSEATAKVGLGAVYARILEKALTSNAPSWARLFLERFDHKFTKPDGAPNSVTNNLNLFASMSEQELKAFVSQRGRQLLGA